MEKFSEYLDDEAKENDNTEEIVREGSRVTIETTDSPGETYEITINEYNRELPVVRAIFGLKLGDQKEYEAPGGTYIVRIVEVKANDRNQRR